MIACTYDFMLKQGFICYATRFMFQQGLTEYVQIFLKWMKVDRHCYTQHTVTTAAYFTTVNAVDVAYCQENSDPSAADTHENIKTCFMHVNEHHSNTKCF